MLEGKRLDVNRKGAAGSGARTVARGFLAMLYVARRPVLEVQPDASGYAVSNEGRHCVLSNDRGRACFSYAAKRGNAYTYSSVMLDVPSVLRQKLDD
jgi:hypothetical protein